MIDYSLMPRQIPVQLYDELVQAYWLSSRAGVDSERLRYPAATLRRAHTALGLRQRERYWCLDHASDYQLELVLQIRQLRPTHSLPDLALKLGISALRACQLCLYHLIPEPVDYSQRALPTRWRPTLHYMITGGELADQRYDDLIRFDPNPAAIMFLHIPELVAGPQRCIFQHLLRQLARGGIGQLPVLVMMSRMPDRDSSEYVCLELQHRSSNSPVSLQQLATVRIVGDQLQLRFSDHDPEYLGEPTHYTLTLELAHPECLQQAVLELQQRVGAVLNCGKSLS